MSAGTQAVVETADSPTYSAIKQENDKGSERQKTKTGKSKLAIIMIFMGNYKN